MIRRAGIVVACSLVALAACAVQPDEANLRDSFVAQIAAVDGVTDVVRDGDELTFSGLDGSSGTVRWRVRFDSTELRSGPGEGVPLEGHIASSWWQDGELVEPLGTMSGLPTAIQDSGIAQVCYALWDAEQQSWGWL
jgi:hypothetical protein